MEYLQTTDFWIGLLKIVWINIILSGDNAVVIAMAARSLPPQQQCWQPPSPVWRVQGNCTRSSPILVDTR